MQLHPRPIVDVFTHCPMLLILLAVSYNDSGVCVSLCLALCPSVIRSVPLPLRVREVTVSNLGLDTTYLD
jgi:hypothetical protein